MTSAKKPRDPAYSFRAVPEVEDAIERHFQRLSKWAPPGVTTSKTDAIASLIIVGAMAWDASDRTGPHGPTNIIEAGTAKLIEASRRPSEDKTKDTTHDD